MRRGSQVRTSHLLLLTTADENKALTGWRLPPQLPLPAPRNLRFILARPSGSVDASGISQKPRRRAGDAPRLRWRGPANVGLGWWATALERVRLSRWRQHRGPAAPRTQLPPMRRTTGRIDDSLSCRRVRESRLARVEVRSNVHFLSAPDCGLRSSSALDSPPALST